MTNSLIPLSTAMFHARMLLLVTSIALLASAPGCIGSRRPPAIRPPSINAGSVASAAVSQYDADGDGGIDRNELETAPSLRFSADRIDSNGDRSIDAEEIKAYVDRHWLQSNAGILAVRCKVTINGRPLNGATVTFEPEAFMGGAIHPGSTQLVRGSGVVDISDDDRPHPTARGVQCGFYLVKVSLVANGKEMIPAKYNTETTLGCEVAARASYMPGPLQLRLSTSE